MDALTWERLRRDIRAIYGYKCNTSSKFLDGMKGLHQIKITITITITYIHTYVHIHTYIKPVRLSKLFMKISALFLYELYNIINEYKKIKKINYWRCVTSLKFNMHVH